MRIQKAWFGGLVALAVSAALSSTASAQAISNIGNVNLNATLPQSVTVSVTSGSSVNFALTENAATNGSVPTVIQTAWNVNPGQVGAVTLYGYFDVPAQALTDGGGNNIPTSWVEGQMTTGTPTTYTTFTQTNPSGPAGGSLSLFSNAITGLNKISSRTDNLDLRINLTGQTLPAGTYTGVLRLQARAL
ncbi:MAG TPA: hypothetical protein VFM00_05090 [Candidatus Eisenbacteria bacterium]|nr:hypothetical protein [Candidatus Eisenbacteria bacterium]